MATKKTAKRSAKQKANDKKLGKLAQERAAKKAAAAAKKKPWGAIAEERLASFNAAKNRKRVQYGPHKADKLADLNRQREEIEKAIAQLAMGQRVAETRLDGDLDQRAPGHPPLSVLKRRLALLELDIVRAEVDEGKKLGDVEAYLAKNDSPAVIEYLRAIR